MNLRLFLTTSSVVLLSWMSLSYVRALPDDGYATDASAAQVGTESVIANKGETAVLAISQ